ncbi:putative PIN family toxin of toxin-antitoxin system [Silvibacterium bohemicum]|uniref:Putative PIN family toxin of toxin-antitoxin system n=1 Tax=Silvibacterium bohemicum TaxID=1577686 RepID=A0A841JVG2_9BACT|nr:putative toxin-antitoxin system toxin component, PIN family [Silvibacterium bohemicum]MBB6145372.1 putative PIN family toxin of toxin-antitoxin system [Silvibacterium bohemicum]
MTRVVLDTNIVISALLNPRGSPAQVFLSAISEPDVLLCVSGDIFAEYEEVIRRPRFNRSAGEIDAALQTIREEGWWVEPRQRVKACSDPDDDKFLACAQAADVHYLVTGNSKHFPAVWFNTRVVTAREFVDAIL